MKLSKLSCLSLIVALCIGLLTLWAAAAPAASAGHAILGAFYPMAEGDCCLDDHTGLCTDAAHPSTPSIPGSLGCTSSSSLIWCEVGGSDPYDTCDMNGEVPCYTIPADNWYCNNTESMECI